MMFGLFLGISFARKPPTFGHISNGDFALLVLSCSWLNGVSNKPAVGR